MRSFLLGAFCFAAGLLTVCGYRQAGARVAADGPPDPVKGERFLRPFYAWPPDTVTPKIRPFKPPRMPGFLEKSVGATPKKGGETISQAFIMSGDGRFLLERAPWRMDGDPFRDIRDQIDTRNQPWFGSPTPKVTIIEYGDLQCSYCKAVVGVLRQDIPREF